MGILGIKSGEHLLWCFAIGFMVACVYAFCVKCVTGKLIRALVREDACNEASALTLAQLGCKGAFYRFALRKGTSLSEAVVTADENDAEKRYYLKPDEKEKMLLKYGAGTNGMFSLLLTLLAAMVAAIIGAMLLPVISGYFGNL